MRRFENRMSNTKIRDATSVSNGFAAMRIQRMDDTLCIGDSWYNVCEG